MRRWVINGRYLSQPLTGVQRCAHELVAALDKRISEGNEHAPGLSVELFAPPDARTLPEMNAIKVRSVGARSGHAWEQYDLATAAQGRGLLSLCNTGPVFHGRQIVCIHDVNTRIAPQSYTRTFRLLYRTLLPALGRSAIRVTTVSSFSAMEIARFGVARPGKIRVIYNGADHARGWPVEASDRIGAVAGPSTVVAFGSAAPHKNIEMLVGLAGRMAEVGLKLAIAGGAAPRIFANGTTQTLPPNVIWLGRVSDGELAALLANCLCLAFPSLTEGFGLPPLEAMTRGCPVIASDRGSLPEVLEGAALFAAADAPEEWMQLFLGLHDNREARLELADEGMRHARGFTWRSAAESYLALMAECDGLQMSAPTERRMSA